MKSTSPVGYSEASLHAWCFLRICRSQVHHMQHKICQEQWRRIGHGPLGNLEWSDFVSLHSMLSNPQAWNFLAWELQQMWYALAGSELMSCRIPNMRGQQLQQVTRWPYRSLWGLTRPVLLCWSKTTPAISIHKKLEHQNDDELTRLSGAGMGRQRLLL